LFPFYARHATEVLKISKDGLEDGRVKDYEASAPNGVCMVDCDIRFKRLAFIPEDNDVSQQVFGGPPGPMPFFFWPSPIVSNVCDQAPKDIAGWARKKGMVGRFQNLERTLILLEHGLDIQHMYSGSCEPEAAMWSEVEFLRSLGFDIPGDALRFKQQCDKNSSCLKIMAVLPPETRAMCQYRALEERLPKPVFDLLKVLEPPTTATPQECTDAYKLMEEVLEDTATAYPEDMASILIKLRIYTHHKIMIVIVILVIIVVITS